MKRDFLKIALENSGQSPCEKFACGMRASCAAKNLACTAFLHYVRFGSARNPRMHIPMRVTKEDQPFDMGSPAPTRKVFDLMESWDDREESFEDSEDVLALAVLNRIELEVAFAEGAA